jgi:hypothetical protein
VTPRKIGWRGRAGGEGSPASMRPQKIGPGIARESVGRILNDWKRRKVVSRQSGYYWIENKAQLQNEAEL